MIAASSASTDVDRAQVHHGIGASIGDREHITLTNRNPNGNTWPVRGRPCDCAHAYHHNHLAAGATVTKVERHNTRPGRCIKQLAAAACAPAEPILASSASCSRAAVPLVRVSETQADACCSQSCAVLRVIRGAVVTLAPYVREAFHFVFATWVTYILGAIDSDQGVLLLQCTMSAAIPTVAVRAAGWMSSAPPLTILNVVRFACPDERRP